MQGRAQRVVGEELFPDCRRKFVHARLSCPRRFLSRISCSTRYNTHPYEQSLWFCLPSMPIKSSAGIALP